MTGFPWRIGVRTSAVALAVLFGSLAIADEAVEEINLLPLTPETLVGQWESLDRHVAMGNLFQPVHGVRKREAVICFHQGGGQLRGYAICDDHRAITNQERWKEGRTEFTKVSIDAGRLTFEFPIGEWFATAGPIAVEDGRLVNKGTVRVKARLTKGKIGPRLVGSWHMFVADGSEVFRGEWEAVRPGPLLLIGGRHQDLPDAIRDVVFEMAGGKEARIVIIPTAIATAEQADMQAELKKPWLDLGARSVEILHTHNPKTVDDPAFVKPLTEATAVFITNGHRDRIFNAYRGTLVERELKALHARGGLIAGTGTGTAVLGQLVVVRSDPAQHTEPGLGLLPGVLTDDRTDREGFPEALAASPGSVGLLFGPDAAVLIRAPRMQVLGEGAVTIRFAAGPRQEASADTYKAGDQLNLDDLRAEAGGRARK